MSYLLVVIKGALVGVANIIPGVSGGTFALVLGIYERLLSAIAAVGMTTVKVTGRVLVHPCQREARQAFVGELKRMDAAWLSLIAIGALAAILACSRLLGFLLEKQLAPTLAFFVGLILPSMAVPYRLLERRGWREAISCAAGAAILVCLTLVQPAGTSSLGLPGLFIAGAIAISAMILPGVSGSFVLMVMGEYKKMIDAINDLDLAKLSVFALGCLLGIVAFVRLLNFLLRRFHSVTLAFLIGLILGSLWVLWPFKEILEGTKIVCGTNVWPASWSAEVTWSCLALLAGLVCSLGVLALGRWRSPEAKAEEESVAA